jgi:hypothetical protein
VQINPDPITGNHPDFDKRMCDSIAEFFQFRIAKRLIDKAHCFSIRAPRRALGQ